MKNRRLFSMLLCLLLVGCTLLLTACPGGEPPVTEPPTPGPITPPVDDTVYGEGTLIDGAGDKLAVDAAIFTPAVYDESAAQKVPAGNFMRVASSAFAAGKVFLSEGDTPARVSGQSDGKIYNGKGSVIIVPQGIEFSGNTNMTVKDLVIVGDVTVKDTDGMVFENVEIIGTLTLDKTGKNIAVNNSRLTGDTAVDTAAEEVLIYASYVGFTACGVKDSGAGLTVQNCRLAGTGTALSTAGEGTTLKYNTISLSKEDTGIALTKGAMNFMAAMNVVTGAQKSVSISEARNAVVVRNTLISVEATGNRNLYICDNEMGGRVAVTSNNYLLADGNTNKAVVQSDNENTNGDTLMDVGARLEVGADENLLPHVDKYQFTDMPRKKLVKDVEATTTTDVYAYIAERVKASDPYVFVPPGAYEAGTALYLNRVSNATIYAYGVYAEETKGNNSFNQGTQITLSSTENITIKGITVGYADQSSGQMHVLEKLDKNRVRVIASPGMVNHFIGTSDSYFPKSEGMYWHRLSRGQDYVYCDTGMNSIRADGTTGTYILTMREAAVWDLVEPGDVFTCRTGSGASTVSTSSTINTVIKDAVIYGSSGGLCFVENNNRSAMTYYRVIDTSRAGEIIDEDTYATYLGLEAEYGISFFMSQDEWGNYRGTPAYISSIDATHVVKCAVGSQIISCLFENMCDDGTNQKSTHGRLAGIEIDEENDIATITYKGTLSQVRVDRKEELKATGFCADFEVGDRVCIYTTEGQLICDTAALTPTVSLGNRPSTYNELPVEYRQVTVKASDIINLDVVATYDLTLDQPTLTDKIQVDNRTRASNGFLMDNTMVKNTRSRGLLLKSSDGAVRNCTFRNNAKCGIAIIYEVYWGESSVSEDIVVEKNLFDNTSYSTAAQVRYRHAPLIIAGLGGGTVAEDCLLYKNIDILNNKFINRNIHVNPYAIYLQAVRDITIIGNDFGEAADETFDYYSTAVELNGAMNIKLENNTYSSFATLDAMITGDHYVNIYGGDVGDIFPDSP